MKAFALTIGGSVIVGDWQVTRLRKQTYCLTPYPAKLGSRTRFGTLGEITDDLAYIERNGALPPKLHGYN